LNEKRGAACITLFDLFIGFFTKGLSEALFVGIITVLVFGGV